MLSFSKFLLEQQDPEEGASRQIKHLTHVEDRPLQTGEKGALRSLSVLKAAANHIANGKKSSELTTKYDGSPSIVYGHHPDNGKFFVASKSAFNKTPKINYTEKDIINNHGHAPGLVEKLKHALKHLPKTAPASGVYQGDMMFSSEDKKNTKEGGVSFNPNPSGLTYTAHGDLGKKAKKAKIELEKAIAQASFKTPICPVYQNVCARPITNPIEIQKNLVDQLTAPVRWTQTMQSMIADGCNEIVEVGPGKVLQGLFKKIQRDLQCMSATEN